MWISCYKILYTSLLIGSSSENTYSPGRGSTLVGVREPGCSATIMWDPAAAASVLVPLRDPGPCHSEPAPSGGAKGCWCSCHPHPQKCNPARLSPLAALWSTGGVTSAREPLWKAAEACHVTDHGHVPLRFPFDTWCVTWSHLMCMDAQAALMGSRSLLTDWAEHQASHRSGHQTTVSNGSALFFASRAWCLLNIFVMLLHEDQTGLGISFFKMLLLFLSCRRSWSLWAGLKASLKITRLVNTRCNYLHISIEFLSLPGVSRVTSKTHVPSCVHLLSDRKMIVSSQASAAFLHSLHLKWHFTPSEAPLLLVRWGK